MVCVGDFGPLIPEFLFLFPDKGGETVKFQEIRKDFRIGIGIITRKSFAAFSIRLSQE